MESKKLTNKKILMLGTAVVSLNTLGANQLTAQTGDVDALATVVAAITVAEVQALHFGRFLTPTAATGTVAIDTAGAAIRTGGIIDASAAGVVQEGIFKITGTDGIPIDVTIQATTDLTGTAGGTMVLSNIDLNTIAGIQNARTGTQAITLPAAGVASFPMGGEIAVDNAQTLGQYKGAVTLNAVYQ